MSNNLEIGQTWIKVICIKEFCCAGSSSQMNMQFNPGDFAEFETSPIEGALYLSKYIKKGESSAVCLVYIDEFNRHFISLAEWRDIQINSILDEKEK